MKRVFLLTLVSLLLAGLLGVQSGTAQPEKAGSSTIVVDNGMPSRLSEIKLRKAISYCTDKSALVLSVYPLLSPAGVSSLVRDSFLSPVHPSYHTPTTLYPYNAAAGKALLEELGWTEPSPGAIRQNAAGQQLILKFTTTTAAFRQVWSAVFEAQMAACGVKIERTHVAASWWFGDDTGLARRDFEIGAFAWVNTPDGGSMVQSVYRCDRIPSAKTTWFGQNYNGWCNATASDAALQAYLSFDPTERDTALASVQDEFGEDVPSLPLFARLEVYAYNKALTGFTPYEGNSTYYAAKAYQWARPGRTTLKWGLAEEPTSLFSITGDYFAGFILAATGAADTTPNYEMQPLLHSQTNAVVKTVAVNAGQKVVDSRGFVVTLNPGVKVFDSTGALVTYSSGSVNMTQITDATYTFLTNLKWNDGTLVSQADFQLGYDITCDPDTLLYTGQYELCNSVQSFTSQTHGYEIDWIPGYRDTAHYMAPFNYFPAHRVVQSGDYAGYTLEQVPAEAWYWLDEVNISPWSAGPYYVSDWVSGNYIELTANPYSVLGAPATQQIRVVFSGNPEGDLIADNLDIVGNESLYSGLTINLINASNVTGVLVPSATWEHVDFNFNYFPKVYLPVTVK